LRYAARSDTGPVRANNQDSGYAGPNLLVVADGMGGHAGGDAASRIAIEALAPLDVPDHTPGAALESLETAIELARAGLVRVSSDDPDMQGMGTTVTALLRTGSTLVMAHMGDSRAYLLRDGRLAQVTVDHTFVQHLVDIGRISPDEAETHPNRNVVMRVLSDFDLDLHPDMSIREARPGDRWLLCSDGLSGFVMTELITQALVDAADPAEAAELLMAGALQAQSTDNITVVVADIEDDSEPADGTLAGQQAAEIVGAAANRSTIHPALPTLDTLRAVGSDETETSEIIDPDPLVDEELIDEGDDDPGILPPPKRHPLLAAIVTLLIAAAVGIGLWQGYEWTQRQYFVGESQGYVAIYRGLPANVGPLTLSQPVELTTTRVEDLPVFFADRLNGTIRASSLAEAREHAERLIEEALPEEEPTEESPPPLPVEGDPPVVLEEPSGDENGTEQ